VKIIQSFWSKPFLHKKESNWEGRKTGGWRDPYYYYMSCALSCLLLNRHYKEVELVTDKYGKKVLMDLMRLPYSSTTCVLDSLNDYPEDLWSIGKIYAYSIQTEPFIHFDNDVFVWSAFSDQILSGRLISQSKEVNFRYDIEILRDMFERFEYLPEDILDFPPERGVVSCNAGVFGGNDLVFFNEYTRTAFNFIHANRSNLHAVNLGLSNLIFEQYLFACMARKRQVPISYVLPDITDYKLLKDFVSVPHKRKYVHMIGHFKTEISSEHWLEERLRLEFPEHYYRIRELCQIGFL
jgi:hypothetical protein